MKKSLWLAVLLLLAVACAGLVVLNVRTNKRLSLATDEVQRYRKTIADLQERIGETETERDSASREARRLQDELSRLISDHKESQAVIEELWSALQRSAQAGGRQDSPEGKGARYDAKAIKDLLTSSEGDLEALLRQIVTPEGINSTLQEHSDDPAYWAAAASLLQDADMALEYLEEAARLYPKSATVLSSLVEALMARDQFDETTMAHIAQLKQVDPANALPDYYDAYCRFQSGDIEGALQSLAEASVKDRLADNRMALLMARNDYLRNEGCTDPVALGLSAFTLPFPHMGMLRGVGRSSMEQARASIAAGQYEDALRIADSVLRTGSNLSSSGRFLIYDLVGMALQESALNEQRRIYEGWGNAFQIEQIDSQLRSLKERLSLMKAMAGPFGDFLQTMTEEDIANYVQGTIRSGEFSTLLNIPGVAEALEQAKKEDR